MDAFLAVNTTFFNGPTVAPPASTISPGRSSPPLNVQNVRALAAFPAAGRGVPLGDGMDQGCLATMGVEGDSGPGGTFHGGGYHLWIQGRSYMLSPLRVVIAALSAAQRDLS